MKRLFAAVAIVGIIFIAFSVYLVQQEIKALEMQVYSLNTKVDIVAENATESAADNSAAINAVVNYINKFIGGKE